ncbi:hypothetical protein G4B88_025815, partial [Cannabis sativa]
MSRRNRDRWIGEYNSSQQILLVGEGDFSFSACLAKAFRYADNMVATSLDSLDVLLGKHWHCQSHLDELEKRDCLVLHEVDVHDMDRHPTLKDMEFDVIVFNFPHAGHVSWLCERDDILIQRHKNLVGGFFRSASKMIKKGGEIHITHRGDEPYNQWEVEKLAQNEGLILKQKVSFLKELYLGYHNKRGSTIQGNKKFPLECSFTSKFSLPHHDIIHHHPKTTAIIGEYMNCEKILLVGEGDFSFSACLAKAFCSAKNMVATSLDTLEELAQNARLILKEKVSFVKTRYPGYNNKRGSVIRGNKEFPLQNPFTFKFSV